jgi:signal transduction histidine kinase
LVGFWENLAVAYRPAAVSRRRLIPLRLFVTLVLCSLAFARPDLRFLIAWAGIFVAAQLVELLALNRFLVHAEPHKVVGLVLLADLVMAVTFGWLAIPLWAMDTPVGAAGAILLLSGSIFTALMGAEGCLVAFATAVAPHIAYLFITPLVSGGGDPMTPFFLIGCGLFCLTLTMVFLWSERTMAAERAARRAAERQTAAKSAFIAMVSHELRTPINAILNSAAALETGGSAALVTDAGVMMRTLLNDLLDLSKIEAGRMGVEVVDYDLPAVVGDAVAFWRETATAKGVELVLIGVETLPHWVRGDPMRTRQVLNNLLSNAIKFTDRGEVRVKVSVDRERPRHVAIVVRDTGPGLKDDQIERLFSPYEQLGVDTARAFGGTGLGLAISRDLARLMGGELTAANAPEGGARFTLRIPAPEGTAPRRAGRRSRSGPGRARGGSGRAGRRRPRHQPPRPAPDPRGVRRPGGDGRGRSSGSAGGRVPDLRRHPDGRAHARHGRPGGHPPPARGRRQPPDADHRRHRRRLARRGRRLPRGGHDRLGREAGQSARPA